MKKYNVKNSFNIHKIELIRELKRKMYFRLLNGPIIPLISEESFITLQETQINGYRTEINWKCLTCNTIFK